MKLTRKQAMIIFWALLVVTVLTSFNIGMIVQRMWPQ
jgi:hypothetical protein